MNEAGSKCSWLAVTWPEGTEAWGLMCPQRVASKTARWGRLQAVVLLENQRTLVRPSSREMPKRLSSPVGIEQTCLCEF